MFYLDQWEALSARITGLHRTGQLHVQCLQINSGDMFNRAVQLREQCEAVLVELRRFRETYASLLPLAALRCIDDFINRNAELITNKDANRPSRQEQVWAALVLLSTLEAELTFLLSDTQERVRTRSERAFAHLQRLIIVDADPRNKWSAAFAEGEVACEKLGAVHLLMHGIWAFKVSATGARTDLVFQEPEADTTDVRRYADGIVLTEWKKANNNEQAVQRFAEARVQARLYAQGVLAGSELTSYRYLVVVSGRQVAVPADVSEQNVIYRHINIAVDPLPPSRA
ncbi:MAG: hypothetical protein A3F74_05925 [Betaproteobacteria bacterium RIFCSPLOWO2_12_FULL_62_58]|nr:MAG: hypothetical protein A3F74_05925 [Betaproteobacteria bacterium RIFCSPLOWO2_12_FULL_62_58]HLE64359.1 hypothetical protein [Pyrinomonadaceae bacterium]